MIAIMKRLHEESLAWNTSVHYEGFERLMFKFIFRTPTGGFRTVKISRTLKEVELCNFDMIDTIVKEALEYT